MSHASLPTGAGASVLHHVGAATSILHDGWNRITQTDPAHSERGRCFRESSAVLVCRYKYFT